ncbi:MAG: transglutaminaseTgpA domain-containing protein [Anaerolineales bacterium]
MTTDRTRQPFDGIALLLLLAMSLLAGWALTTTEWAEHLNIVPLIGLLGVLSGAALARTRFPRWLAAFFASVYGLFVVGFQIGLTLNAGQIWQRRILNLLGRIGVFTTVVLTGKQNQDPLMFVLIMSIVFWTVGAISAWSAFRSGRVWTSILPGALTILLISYYYLGEARLGIFLGVFLFLSLILAVRMELMRKQEQWAQARARVPLDAPLRISLSSLIAAALLVIVAWGAPAFARSESLSETWQRVSQPFDRVRTRVGDAFGTLHGPSAVVASEYDDVLQLGAGTQPNNRLVMLVDPERFPEAGGRFYWRSRVYDRYIDYQWFSPQGDWRDFDPAEGDLPLGDLEGRELIDVSIAPQSGAFKLLHLPAEVAWIDRGADVLVNQISPAALDILRVEADQIVYEGETYIARSAIAVPSASQLRAAGSGYPEFIARRYLQLSDTVTPRTRDLATQIAANFDNPYDQTVAVTRWLRSNISYSRVTDAPPSNIDPIDWFLFDYRIGFCNYYASAEVVMLRSLGIPARLAAGYARGEYVPEAGVYEVYGEDAHAWPEVYFPGYGWVEFEPTASQPALTRPELTEEELAALAAGGPNDSLDRPSPEDLNEPLLEPEVDPGLEATPASPGNLLRNVLLGLVGAALLAMGWIRFNPATWIALRSILQRGMSQVGVEPLPALSTPAGGWETPTGRIYAAWTAWLKRLGLAESQAETARERVERFSAALPESAAPAHVLAEAYMTERFGLEQVDVGSVRAAWRRLRGKLWLAWIWKLTERWRQDPVQPR